MAHIQPVYTAALVGCGRIGYSLGLDRRREQPSSHTMALRASRRIRLVAGCDCDADTLRTWHAANRNASVYGSSAELYASCRPDIVTVAVNEAAHKKEALSAIRAKPRLVILEKPVALNTAEAREIAAAAQELHVPVLINHERRFASDYRVAKEYMSRIGAVQSVRASLYSGMCVYDPAEESSGAYSLIHDGTHLADIVLFLLEREGEVYDAPLLAAPAVTGIFRDEKGCVRQLCAHYSLPQCPDVTLMMSGRSRYFGFEVQVDGTEGRVCIGNGYLTCYRRKQSRLYTGFYSLMRDASVRIPRKTGYFSNMVQNAVDFLDGNAPLRSTLRTGMNALAVLEEIKGHL